MKNHFIKPDPDGVNELSVERAHQGYVVRHLDPKSGKPETIVCMNFNELMLAVGSTFHDELDKD